MVTVEHLCMYPFQSVDLECDVCGHRTNGPDRGHVVELQDGRTICKECFEGMALQAESFDAGKLGPGDARTVVEDLAEIDRVIKEVGGEGPVAEKEFNWGS